MRKVIFFLIIPFGGWKEVLAPAYEGTGVFLIMISWGKGKGRRGESNAFLGDSRDIQLGAADCLTKLQPPSENWQIVNSHSDVKNTHSGE